MLKHTLKDPRRTYLNNLEIRDVYKLFIWSYPELFLQSLIESLVNFAAQKHGFQSARRIIQSRGKVAWGKH